MCVMSREERKRGGRKRFKTQKKKKKPATSIFVFWSFLIRWFFIYLFIFIRRSRTHHSTCPEGIQNIQVFHLRSMTMWDSFKKTRWIHRSTYPEGIQTIPVRVLHLRLHNDFAGPDCFFFLK